MLEAAELRKIISYNPDAGEFRWIADRTNVRAGSIAGTVSNSGYCKIRIAGKLYFAHRLAWLYMTGAWPLADVDHRNGARADNRWENLRAASRSQNCANRRCIRHHTIGLKGVQRSGNRYRATIMLARGTGPRKKISLGGFPTPESAHTAYLAAARKMFGDFASDGAKKTH